jgi:hypothetical protein
VSGTPGRPLSSELSEQLVAVAVDILAEEGWGPAQQRPRRGAGAGGQGRDLPALALDVGAGPLGGEPLLPGGRARDEGSPRADLTALVASWRRPLSREERAVASLVGAARHDEELRAGWTPRSSSRSPRPSTRWARAGPSTARRCRPSGWRCCGRCWRPFWWQRLTVAGDGAMVAEHVEQVVDEVLLPIVAPALEPART